MYHVLLSNKKIEKVAIDDVVPTLSDEDKTR